MHKDLQGADAEQQREGREPRSSLPGAAALWSIRGVGPRAALAVRHTQRCPLPASRAGNELALLLEMEKRENQRVRRSPTWQENVGKDTSELGFLSHPPPAKQTHHATPVEAHQHGARGLTERGGREEGSPQRPGTRWTEGPAGAPAPTPQGPRHPHKRSQQALYSLEENVGRPRAPGGSHRAQVTPTPCQPHAPKPLHTRVAKRARRSGGWRQSEGRGSERPSVQWVTASSRR